jgi:hypothetical protein
VQQIKAVGHRVAAVRDLVATAQYADALDAVAAVQATLSGPLAGVRALRGLARQLDDVVRDDGAPTMQS